MPKLKIFLAILFFLVALVILFLFSPAKRILPTGIAQSTDYSSALAAIQQEQQKDVDLIKPDCVSKLLTHDQKTQKVVVFFHGYTSCPQQFLPLAEVFFDAGYNVYIPRAPYHGYKDRLTDTIGHLTAQEYIQFAEQSVANARGLGEDTTVVGLSGGGVLAAWSAQYLTGINQALLLSPGIGLYTIPEWQTLPVVHAYEFLPTEFRWWNEQEKETSGISYEYPRFSVNVLARIVGLGYSVVHESTSKAPTPDRVIFVYNPSDRSIAQSPIELLEKNWQAKVGDKVSSYTFPVDWDLAHSFVNPDQSDKHIPEVFAKLLELANHD